jgi:ParB-like nuclease domain
VAREGPSRPTQTQTAAPETDTRLSSRWHDRGVLQQVAICALVGLEEGHLDQRKVREYAQVLDAMPPVAVFDAGHELVLADGHHRVAAAQQLGRIEVKAEVRPGTRADALAYAVALAGQERGISETDALRAIGRFSGLPSNLAPTS